mgnify:CR=1 FL=1
MLEVALIKLCRPQMEQDQLSVLERVRRLEKQLASGVVVRQQDTGGYTPEGNFDYQNPVNVAAPGGIDPDGTAGNTDPAKLQQAAPEDLQKIVGMWRTILAQTSGVSVWFWQVPFRNLIQKKKMVRFISYFLIFWERLMSMIRRKQKYSSRSLQRKQAGRSKSR